MRPSSRSVVAALIAISVLSACSGNPVTDDSKDVAFTPCSDTECSGTLPGGAEFDIVLPEQWNGTLAVFSGGVADQLERPGGTGSTGSSAASASAGGAGSDSSADAGASDDTDALQGTRNQGSEASTAAAPSPSASPTLPMAVMDGPQPAPQWGEGDNVIADALLQSRYAIAGAGPTRSGWSVAAQMTAAEELYDYFAEHVAKPNRVYVWGEGTGGLTSVRLAETEADWVSGAVAMCAPLSGPNPSFNLALDAAYAVRELLYPAMKLVGYSSESEATRLREEALARVDAAAGSGDPNRQARVLFISDVTGLPPRTSTQFGGSLTSQLDAATEGIANLLDQSTVQRYWFERLVGGNPSGNAGTDYKERITPEQSARLNVLSKGVSARLISALVDGPKVEPDEHAMAVAAGQGQPVGDLTIPVLTLHNRFDPVYITQNESWYRVRVDQNGTESAARLVQAFVMPPTYFSSTDPAAEGAGNCNFEARTAYGALLQLDLWVRNEQYPGRDSVARAFGSQSVTLDYTPAPWPEMALTPEQPPLEPAEAPAASATPIG